MKKISRLLSSSAAVVAVLNCSPENATGPEGGLSQLSPGAVGNATKMVPMKETYQATGTAHFSSVCGGQLLVSLAGGGQATHVGRYTVTNSHCLDFDTGVFTAGSFTKTAPNGDLLEGEYSGTSRPLPAGSDPCVLRFELNTSLRFTGGTGRFAGASGEATLIALQETNVCLAGFPTSVSGVIEGEISQVGGD
jgi:hypothetical protein